MQRTARLAALILLAIPANSLAAQEEATAAWNSSYELPPASVQRLFDVDKNYATLDNLSPDGRHALVPHYQELATLRSMSQPTQRLAGLELRGQRNRTWRLDTHGITGLDVYDLEQRSRHPLELPEGVFVSDMTWSPDGTQVAMLVHGPSRTDVWVADIDAGAVARLSDAPVLATLGTRSQGRTRRQSRMLQWTPSGSVVTLLVPADRGPAPQRGIAAGPLVRRTRDAPEPNPTYPFLLQDALDAESFRYYTTSQIAELTPGEAPRPIGEPGMFESLALSPDGDYLLAERIVEPLSPLVSYRSFGRKLEVLRFDGKLVSELRQRPLQEGRRRGAQTDRDLPREVAWLPDRSGIVYLQRPAGRNADDELQESAQQNVPVRDRILRLEPPFDPAQANTVASSEHELSDLRFDAAATHAFVHQALEDGHRSLVMYSTVDGSATTLVRSWDAADPLADPGELMTVLSSNGVESVRATADSVFLQGAGLHEDFHPRPFIDRVPLDGTDRVRLFEGSADVYERPVAALDNGIERLIVERQSPDTFPDSWLWTRREGMVDKLTDNHDPFPDITAARRIDFEFTRRDGLTIQARISMPLDWQEGQRVPAIFWTYPREYASAEAYQRAAIRGRSHSAFTQLSYLRWSDIWLTQGYALVYPDVPIIGDPYNDQYVQDLSDSLYAAIRKVDTMGLVDIDRIGHGGHSYGAFATANLLAHTPYFKAGIAGDGAYNRTLTPMGFQSERRYVWDAEDVYLEMSPFFQADHLDTPLLMYHGGNDNNTGTFPIQSRRMIQALTGLGKTAVLYEYPYESHGPSARATYLDLWRRWLDWFDTYVKNPAQENPE